MLIRDVNQLLGIHLSDEDVDTIGGWFLTQNHDARMGAVVEYSGYTFTVQAIDGYHILYLDVEKV